MKKVNIGLLIAAILWLILSMVDAWAIDVIPGVINKPTMEETIETSGWTEAEKSQYWETKKRLDARIAKENDEKLSCVAKGGNPQICVDPHWCLYPSNENKSECVKYNIKHGFF